MESAPNSRSIAQIQRTLIESLDEPEGLLMMAALVPVREDDSRAGRYRHLSAVPVKYLLDLQCSLGRRCGSKWQGLRGILSAHGR